MSPIASPRSKITRSHITSNEFSLIHTFVKTNLKLLLRLISSEIHMIDNIQLSHHEFDALWILLYFEDDPTTFESMSKKSPFFKELISKADTNTVYEWLMSKLSMSEDSNWVTFPALSKCVTIWDSESVYSKDLRLINCEDSYVYIDCPINSISMTNCVNCTIVAPAVKRTCTIDKCEKMSITVATNFIRIGSCVDSKVFSYSIQVPYLFGDNRGVVLAPFNAGFVGLK